MCEINSTKRGHLESAKIIRLSWVLQNTATGCALVPWIWQRAKMRFSSKIFLSSGNINITSEHRTTLWMASNLPGAERMLSIAAIKTDQFFQNLKLATDANLGTQAERGGDRGVARSRFPPGPPPPLPRAPDLLASPVGGYRGPGVQTAARNGFPATAHNSQTSTLRGASRGHPSQNYQSPIPPILRVTNFTAQAAPPKESSPSEEHQPGEYLSRNEAFDGFARFWGRKSGNWRSKGRFRLRHSARPAAPLGYWRPLVPHMRSLACAWGHWDTLGAFGGKSRAFPGRKWRSGGSRDAWAQQEAALAPTLGRREDYFWTWPNLIILAMIVRRGRVGCLY